MPSRSWLQSAVVIMDKAYKSVVICLLMTYTVLLYNTMPHRDFNLKYCFFNYPIVDTLQAVLLYFFDTLLTLCWRMFKKKLPKNNPEFSSRCCPKDIWLPTDLQTWTLIPKLIRQEAFGARAGLYEAVAQHCCCINKLSPRLLLGVDTVSKRVYFNNHVDAW